jgi:DNA-binding winged helix-turn-helix (wHTH) protein
MTVQRPARHYRFGSYEADASSGELRRQGIRIKLHAQPFRVLVMLLERPGELLTREQIAQELWPEGTFVDFEHGVNSAVNRIREALGDTANSPRFVETLARRGYRFVAPVERVGTGEEVEPPDSAPEEQSPTRGILATEGDFPRTPHAVVLALFVLLQLMYLGFYVGALANLGEIRDLLAPLPQTEWVLDTMVGTAIIFIPVRVFLLCAAAFGAPGFDKRFRKLWPVLLMVDVLWAMSPILLLHHIPIGLALAGMPVLVYAPFAQRSLVLMGAGRTARQPEAMAR